MITFSDIFKKSFISEVGTVSLSSAVFTLFFALFLGLLIYSVYRYAFSGVVYSKNYNVSLVAVCLVTAIIVIAISTNIVLSLGMVGALSIVRFRTAIKEPMDVAYMYWAITTGIVCGARLYLFAFIATLLVGIIFVLMNKIKDFNHSHILIVNYQEGALFEIENILKGTKYIVKSRNLSDHENEFVAEVKLKNENSAFLNNIREIKNVNHVSLLSYKGE